MKISPFHVQRYIEFMVVVAVVGLAATLFMGVAKNYLIQAQVNSIDLPAIKTIKDEMILHRAITGEWPRGRTIQGKDLGRKDLPLAGSSDKEGMDKLVIGNGVMHVTFGPRKDIRSNSHRKHIIGRTLSFLCGIPAEDPLGPVIFVAGDPIKYINNGWSFSGEDRTDLYPLHYPKGWK